jgi:hypothetical protein
VQLRQGRRETGHEGRSAVGELRVRFLASDERVKLLRELRGSFSDVPDPEIEEALAEAVAYALQHAQAPGAGRLTRIYARRRTRQPVYRGPREARRGRTWFPSQTSTWRGSARDWCVSVTDC